MATVFGTGFDEGGVYSSQQGQVTAGENDGIQTSDATRKFREFIRHYRDGTNFIYRDQLRQNTTLGKNMLEINFEDLKAFDEPLADLLETRPNEYLPVFETAAKEAVLQVSKDHTADIQIVVRPAPHSIKIRNLLASHLAKIVHIRGIVISASKTRAKATEIALQCRTCHDMKTLPVRPGFSGVTMPRKCLRENAAGQPSSADCGLDPYMVVPDKSRYSDQQTLKVQESPEDVPTGEMPRQVLLAVDRHLVNRVVPGTRVSVCGIYSIFQQKTRGGASGNLPNPYIRVVGLEVAADGAGRASSVFLPEEEEEFREFANSTNVYETIAEAIDPAIFGHEDIKKAITCLLFGGSRKTLPDGMRLRGDVNVLLLGDPGTAKSQFLKFVERVAPIGVYTSGKGSSAAGLTASVIREPSTREFYLEGGAMVLADGGVVCIDEFDKMREQDRVAIHEAMEQQTISIAKAGITTVLNSRTSVLAAANPLFGRYDDLKSAADQIDFASTILSRFDLIFIVRDHKDEERDQRIARHVLQIHKSSSANVATVSTGLTTHFLKKFISYCRTKCAPRLSPEAATVLADHYVSIRSGVREQREKEGMMPTIPITVRQLEAIIRLSESLAKMTMSNVARQAHVEEAIRLFKVATLEAASTGNLVAEGFSSPEVMQEIQRVEGLIKKRLAIGSTFSESRLVHELQGQGLTEFSIRKAINVMIQRDELEHRNQRRQLHRKR